MSSYSSDVQPSGSDSTDSTASTPVFNQTVAETPFSEATDALYAPGDEAESDTDETGSMHESTPREVAATAQDAAQSAAAVSRDQAKEVASEVTGQASDLLRKTGSELRDQAANQQQRLAEGLRALGSEFGSMAEESDSSGVASELVTNLSRRSGDLAAWLDERDPGSLLREVKSFAARRPGTFIAIAAGAGVVAGRLAKSLTASASDESAES